MTDIAVLAGTLWRRTFEGEMFFAFRDRGAMLRAQQLLIDLPGVTDTKLERIDHKVTLISKTRETLTDARAHCVLAFMNEDSQPSITVERLKAIPGFHALLYFIASSQPSSTVLQYAHFAAVRTGGTEVVGYKVIKDRFTAMHESTLLYSLEDMRRLGRRIGVQPEETQGNDLRP